MFVCTLIFQRGVSLEFFLVNGCSLFASFWKYKCTKNVEIDKTGARTTGVYGNTVYGGDPQSGA